MKLPKRVLEPSERISEILFGLIMVLTFTGTISVAESNHDDIRVILVAALGCNVAWGIIDAVFYLMSCLAERARNLAMFRDVRRGGDPSGGQHLILSSLPPVVASVLKPEEIEFVRERLTQLPAPPDRASLSGRDWFGGFGVFLLVFLSTFPVVIPFMCMHNARMALRISNLIAIGILFLAGTAYGRQTSRNPFVAGIAMVVVGLILVSVTMALGG